MTADRPERPLENIVRWIPVLESLPQKGERVLVFDGDNIEFGAYGEFSDMWDGDYHWCAENYGHDGSEGKFDCTHWMKIPYPPNK